MRRFIALVIVTLLVFAVSFTILKYDSGGKALISNYALRNEPVFIAGESTQEPTKKYKSDLDLNYWTKKMYTWNWEDNRSRYKINRFQLE